SLRMGGIAYIDHMQSFVSVYEIRVVPRDGNESSVQEIRVYPNQLRSSGMSDIDHLQSPSVVRDIRVVPSERDADRATTTEAILCNGMRVGGIGHIYHL